MKTTGMALIPIPSPLQNNKREIYQGTGLENPQKHNPLLQSFPNRKTAGKLIVYQYIDHIDSSAHGSRGNAYHSPPDAAFPTFGPLYCSHL